MGSVKDAGVRKLMEDEELLAEVAKAIVEDPEAMDDLADDIVDNLGDELEDNLELRRQILDAAVTNPEFKKKIIAKLANEPSD